mgnify:CR=1 FL=1
MGVALKGNVLAAQLLCGFLHIHPFEWRNGQKSGPNRLRTVAIGVPPTESELYVTGTPRGSVASYEKLA